LIDIIYSHFQGDYLYKVIIMKNYYQLLRDIPHPAVIVIISVILIAPIPNSAIAQDAVIQSPVPQYRADEINQRIVPGLNLMLDEPVTVDLEIRVQDLYYTGIGHHDTYPEDYSESLSEQAVTFLNNTPFQGESVNSALLLIAEHIHEDYAWSDRLVTVGLAIPPLFRGSLPFRLAMETGNPMRMRTSFTLTGLHANIHDNDIFDLELHYETDSDILIDPYQIRSGISDYLNQTQLLPVRIEEFNRMLAEHILEAFDDIHWLRSVVRLDETPDFPVQLKSVLSIAPVASIAIAIGTLAESVTMSGSGLSGSSPDTLLPGFELQLVYEEGLDAGDFPDLNELHDLIRQAIADPDTAAGGREDFMNGILEAIDVVAGNAAREISLYVDPNPGDVVEDGQNRVRYLARKAEPLLQDRTMYTGYELSLSSLETFLGTIMDFRLEMIHYYNSSQFYDPLPEPEVLSDSIRSHALNPVAHPTTMENDVMLNRYLNALAYNFGEFWGGGVLDWGTLASVLSGTHDDESVFSHTLEGVAGYSNSVLKESGIPSAIRLFQNYPNPFNPQTSITFEISQAGDVTLDIYDLTGRKIAVLAEGLHQQGTHNVTFDAGNLASGVYIARFQSGTETRVLKMMMIK
jgi:hypothetical protein